MKTITWILMAATLLTVAACGDSVTGPDTNTETLEQVEANLATPVYPTPKGGIVQ